jgi:hypothetical protein
MLGQTVRELLEEKVTLDVEGIDRLYLNPYQPMLQTGGRVATFFKGHRGAKVASTVLMGPMSHSFGVWLFYNDARRLGNNQLARQPWAEIEEGASFGV